MMERNCLYCLKYEGCRNRHNRMRKVKLNHCTNSREDIRTRIAMMQHIAEQCPMYEVL